MQDGGTASDLRSVFFVDAQVGWAVGDKGLILHSEDGGKSWRAQSSGTAGMLDSVFFVSPKVGWAVGAAVILHTAGRRKDKMVAASDSRGFVSAIRAGAQVGFLRFRAIRLGCGKRFI